MKKQILTFCASVLTAFSGFCLPGMTVCADADYDAAAQKALTYAERASGHFYYDWLDEFDRAAGYKRYYAYLDDFCKRLVSYSGDFTRGEYFVELNADSPVIWAPDLSGLSNDDQLGVFHMFLLDHPYYVFMFPAFTIDDTLKLPFAFDFDTAAGRKQVFAKINAYIDSYSEAGSVSGTYERAKSLHDALCVKNTYTYDSSNHPSEGGWPNNIYGPVYYNTSVCEGYALTYHLLAQYYGLETACVSGSSRNEAHMWDILKMDDGLFYYVDVTWDDSLDPPGTWTKDYRDDYFVKGSDVFDRDHNRDTQASYVHQPVGDAAESRIIPSLAKAAYGASQKPVTTAASTAVSAASVSAQTTVSDAESTASVQTSSETAASESTASETVSSGNTTSALTAVSTSASSETGAEQSAASGSTSAVTVPETTAAASVTTAAGSTDSAQSGSKLWIIVLAATGGSVLLGAAVMLFRKKPK